ncbi:MAG: thioredoxin family protein [Firmicutes bacterium]|nr:thioredoxin family protein [Bacillota bacterium]
MEVIDLYNSGISFDKFVDNDGDTYKDKTLEILNSIEFEDKLIKQIKEIDKKVNVLVCAEIWCPDCMINVPVIQKMKQLNKNIKLSIVEKDGNEAFFIEHSYGENVKIPTFIFYNEKFEKLGVFIEYPKKIKDIVANGNQPNIIVAKRKYRKGEYAQETLKDILQILS